MNIDNYSYSVKIEEKVLFLFDKKETEYSEKVVDFLNKEKIKSIIDIYRKVIKVSSKCQSSMWEYRKRRNKYLQSLHKEKNDIRKEMLKQIAWANRMKGRFEGILFNRREEIDIQYYSEDVVTYNHVLTNATTWGKGIMTDDKKWYIEDVSLGSFEPLPYQETLICAFELGVRDIDIELDEKVEEWLSFESQSVLENTYFELKVEAVKRWLGIDDIFKTNDIYSECRLFIRKEHKVSVLEKNLNDLIEKENIESYFESLSVLFRDLIKLKQTIEQQLSEYEVD